jgi:hypothetical protein
MSRCHGHQSLTHMGRLIAASHQAKKHGVRVAMDIGKGCVEYMIFSSVCEQEKSTWDVTKTGRTGAAR